MISWKCSGYVIHFYCFRGHVPPATKVRVRRGKHCVSVLLVKLLIKGQTLEMRAVRNVCA